MPNIRLISYDCETWGTKPEYQLQPWRVSEGLAGINCFAFGWESDGKVKTKGIWMRDDPATGRIALEQFLQFAKHEDMRIVCHNTVFDMAWLLAYGMRGLVFENRWVDSMLLARRTTNSPVKDRSYGLKALVAEHLPQFAGYEQGVTFNPQTHEERQALQKYNRLDAGLTLVLAQKFWGMLFLAEQRNALIEAACLPMVAESNLLGLYINRENLTALDECLVKAAEKALAELTMAIPDIGAINLNSPAQIAELLFTRLGLTPIKQTSGGADSTDKETLHELALNHPLARALHEYREATGNRTKFSTAVATSLKYNGDGAVRPQFRVFATYTGRGSYSSAQRKNATRSKTADFPIGFALHQMKRGPLFRKVITAPPGYTMIELDASAQEFRIMAVVSGDENMLRLCEVDEDAHTWMAAQIGSMDYQELRTKVATADPSAKALRQLGKVSNLSSNFRISAKSLRTTAQVQHGIPMDEETAARVHATYLSSYPQVPQYWRRQVAKCSHTRVVETLGGRRCYLPGDWTYSLEQTAISFPIQGSGADMKYLALRVLAGYLSRVEGRFYFEMHDSVCVIVPDRNVERAAVEMKALLSNLPYEKAGWPNIPIKFPWEAKVGKTWGEMSAY